MFNFLAYNYWQSDGYGRMAQRIVKALLKAGVNVRPDLTDVLDYPHWQQQAAGLDVGRDNLFLAPASRIRSLPGRVFAWTMYEATVLPEGWTDILNGVHRVIVPCEWLREVMRENGVYVPAVSVVPGGIDPDECPLLPRNTHRPFTFMLLADRYSRKGDDIGYMAFFKAFGRGASANNDVRLIMKMRDKIVTARHIGDPRISIWQENVPNMADVYARADCYVFPTRGEGYGMPPREAAACGLPVIATRWSGTADNIDHWAIPIDNYEMEYSTLEGHGEWARPDVDECAEHMRWVYDHQDAARALGERSSAWLKANETYDCAAAKIMQIMSGAR